MFRDKTGIHLMHVDYIYEVVVDMHLPSEIYYLMGRTEMNAATVGHRLLSSGEGCQNYRSLRLAVEQLDSASKTRVYRTAKLGDTVV